MGKGYTEEEIDGAMKIKYKIIFFALLISLSILSLSWVTYRFMENLQTDHLERIHNQVQAIHAADSGPGGKTEAIQGIKNMKARVRGGEGALLYVIIGILCFNLGAVFLFLKVVLDPIKKLSVLIGHISSGDFVSKVDPVSGNDEFGELYENVLRIKTGLGGILQDVAFLGAQVSGSAEELQSTSEQIVTGMKNQNQKADFIATALEELNKTIQNVAQNATESFHAAEKMVRFA